MTEAAVIILVCPLDALFLCDLRTRRLLIYKITIIYKNYIYT